MNITEQSVIGELVATNYRCATVFKHHKIDFCCQGGRTVAQACQEKGVDSSALINQLSEAIAKPVESLPDVAHWPIDLLADYIQKTHHRYVAQRIKDIPPFLDKVARVHGQRHPELLEIRELFMGATEELTHHMMKEEQILFPYVRSMMDSERAAESKAAPHFGSVEHPIAMMEHEHAVEGERFRRIAELSNDYTPPADACNTYRVAFALLKEFEEDLHQHIHLENNILFPKAIEMEQVVA